MTRVEFYLYGADHPIENVDSAGAVPAKGQLVSLGGKTWKVCGVTWAVDTFPLPGQLRCNIIVEPNRKRPRRN